jgi:hypothetical protein
VINALVLCIPLYLNIHGNRDLSPKHIGGYKLMYDLIMFLLVLIYINNCGAGLTFIVHFYREFRTVNMDYPIFI